MCFIWEERKLYIELNYINLRKNGQENHEVQLTPSITFFAFTTSKD